MYCYCMIFCRLFFTLLKLCRVRQTSISWLRLITSNSTWQLTLRTLFTTDSVLIIPSIRRTLAHPRKYYQVVETVFQDLEYEFHNCFLGVRHTEDLLYVFYTPGAHQPLDQFNSELSFRNPNQVALTRHKVVKMLTNFAKYG